MPADEDDDAPPPPKRPETKKVPKKPLEGAPGPAPAPAKGTGKTKKVTKGETPVAKPPADDEAPAEKPKKATGAIKKPLAKSDGKGSAKPKRAGPPQPPPATRGGIDYALAALAPLACGGLGAFAFLTLSTALAHCNNPILTEKFTEPPAVAIAKNLELAWMTPMPWLPIASGAGIGLLATLCFLKMAPGIGARLMGGGIFAFALLSTVPFLLAGRQIDAAARQLLKKEYAAPRGGELDPRIFTFKADDFEQRKFLSAWKVDLDDGEIPVSWIATAKEELGGGAETPEDEKKILHADLRIALAKGRELAKSKTIDEAVWKRLQDLRDRVNADRTTPSDDFVKLSKARDAFEKKLRIDLAKPPKPKGSEAWFERFICNGDYKKVGNPSVDDRPKAEMFYFGKAIHSAVKELPADMHFAACLRALVKETAKVEPLTRYDYVWVCYDLEKIDDPKLEPVLIPDVKGVLDEVKFKIEVLGEKGPESSGSDKKPADKKPDEKKPDEKPPEEKKPDEKKPDEKPPEEKPPEEKKPEDK
jgi:hypothetical protein